MSAPLGGSEPSSRVGLPRLTTSNLWGKVCQLSVPVSSVPGVPRVSVSQLGVCKALGRSWLSWNSIEVSDELLLLLLL